MSDLENSFLGENSRKISFQLRLDFFREFIFLSFNWIFILKNNFSPRENSFENRIDFSDDI